MSNELRLVGSLAGQAFLSASFTMEACSRLTEKFAALLAGRHTRVNGEQAHLGTAGTNRRPETTLGSWSGHCEGLDTKGSARGWLTGWRSGSRAGRASCGWCRRVPLQALAELGRIYDILPSVRWDTLRLLLGLHSAFVSAKEREVGR